MQEITLKTEDGITLSGLYYEPREPQDARARAVVCLHMMPATKESWNECSGVLSAKGLGVLAIDLRGHGASTGGPRGYESFTKHDHQGSYSDVEAAIAYLRGKGFKEIVMLGASIGANLALQAIGRHEEMKTAIVLSPGLNYYGVETMPIIDQLVEQRIFDKRILFVTSEDDERKSGANTPMVQQLFLAAPDEMQKKIIIYHAAGHGTDMFGKESPDLQTEILKWIQ